MIRNVAPTAADGGYEPSSSSWRWIGRLNPTSVPAVSRGVAQIRPPIASTSWRHTNSPIPAPLAMRVADFDRKNSSNALRGVVAGDPDPLVEDPDDDLVALGPHGDGDRPPLVRVLRGVRQQVPDDLLDVRLLADRQRQPGLDRRRRSSDPSASARPPRPAGRAARARSARRSTWTIPRSARDRTSRSSTSRWSRSASPSMSSIAFETTAPSSDAPRWRSIFESAVDRRDRRPQLVADHPDERVAQLARPDLRRVVRGQLDRPREHPDDRLEQLDVGLAERVDRRRVDLDEADAAPASDDRDAEPGLEPLLALRAARPCGPRRACPARGTARASRRRASWRLGPRRSRDPSASFANGPTAARMTSSSPWTSAIEPPVNAVAVRSRSSVSWRMWSRSRSPAAAPAMSMISCDVAADRLAGAPSSPAGWPAFVTAKRYSVPRRLQSQSPLMAGREDATRLPDGGRRTDTTR